MALSGSEINNTQGVQANSGVQSNSTVNVQVGTGAGVNKAQANTTSGLLKGTSLGFKNQNLGILNRKGSSEQCRKIAGIIKNVLEDKEVEVDYVEPDNSAAQIIVDDKEVSIIAI